MANDLEKTPYAASKEELSRYINDVAELEVRKHTLSLSVEEAKNKLPAISEEAEANVKKAEEALEKAKDSLKQKEDELRESSKPVGLSALLGRGLMYIMVLTIIGALVGYIGIPAIAFILLIMFCMIAPIFMLLPESIENSIADFILNLTEKYGFKELSHIGIIIGPILFFLVSVTYSFFHFKKQKDTRIKKLKELPQEIENCQKEIKQKEQDLALAKENRENALAAIDIVKNKIDEAAKSRDLISDNLDRMYALNIIPPDYRTLDCVHVVNHYFRNGLVNTVSEAILLYREEVYQGKVLESLDGIKSAIGNLSSVMREMQRTLKSIDEQMFRMANDIADIAGDMSSVASSSKESANAQKEIAREASLSRYATESLKESTDKLVYYEDQRKSGLF